jgi:hypothetical protein
MNMGENRNKLLVFVFFNYNRKILKRQLNRNVKFDNKRQIKRNGESIYILLRTGL